MIISKTKFKGLTVIKGRKFKDNRGSFREILRENIIDKK